MRPASVRALTCPFIARRCGKSLHPGWPQLLALARTGSGNARHLIEGPASCCSSNMDWHPMPVCAGGRTGSHRSGVASGGDRLQGGPEADDDYV